MSKHIALAMMTILAIMLTGCGKDDDPAITSSLFSVNGTTCFAPQIAGNPLSTYDDKGLDIVLSRTADNITSYAYVIGMECQTAPTKFESGMDLTSQISMLEIAAPKQSSPSVMDRITSGTVRVDKAKGESLWIKFDNLNFTARDQQTFVLEGTVELRYLP